jgi:hypothetical protein
MQRCPNVLCEIDMLQAEMSQAELLPDVMQAEALQAAMLLQIEMLRLLAGSNFWTQMRWMW